MKFLLDAHRDRVALRCLEWPEGVEGQLMTPLTRYRRSDKVIAIDNGCFSGFDEQSYVNLLKREVSARDRIRFVCVPDKVGSHLETVERWKRYNHLADGFKKAFVAQDGYDGYPEEATTLFIGGTTAFKDSEAAQDAVKDALAKGLNVHIGRINSVQRFIKFHLAGAHTCDGSGASRFPHALQQIRQAVENLK